MDIVDFVTLSLSLTHTGLDILGIFNQYDDYCLSPDLNDSADRPVPIFINITDTTIAIRWEVPKLPDNCAGRVVSSLPLTYRVDLRITTHHSVPDYPVVSLIHSCCCCCWYILFHQSLLCDFVFFSDSLQTRGHLNKFTTLY